MEIGTQMTSLYKTSDRGSLKLYLEIIFLLNPALALAVPPEWADK